MKLVIDIKPKLSSSISYYTQDINFPIAHHKVFMNPNEIDQIENISREYISKVLP